MPAYSVAMQDMTRVKIFVRHMIDMLVNNLTSNTVL
ncbi:hypothetical protein NTGM5_120084 [Candidatus Nitrotoga sp. M5]|nr:hypothetical protein NTGM5_120084 [Candidatus Nitrotoga sp. M5]